MYFTVGEIRVDKREDASISCNYFGYYKQTVKEATRTDEKGELQALKRSVEETKKRSSFQRGWRRCRDSHRAFHGRKAQEDDENGERMRAREREREREREKLNFEIANVPVAWLVKMCVKTHYV